MAKILFTDKLMPECKSRLEAEGHEVDVDKDITQEEFEKKLLDYEGFVVRSKTKLTRELIERGVGTHLFYGRKGVGVDNIQDIEYALANGIAVANTPFSSTTSVKEHVFAFMLAAAKRLAEYDASMKRGEWLKGKLPAYEMHGKTLGVFGLGRIGRSVAQTAVNGFGMNIIYSDPFVDDPGIEGVVRVSEQDLFANSDFLTMHVGLNAETKGVVTDDMLHRMKKRCVLINTSRYQLFGGDLSDFLRESKDRVLCLDVFEKEPPQEVPFSEFGYQTILTPHSCASTPEAQMMSDLRITEEIIDYFKLGVCEHLWPLGSLPPNMYKLLRLTAQMGKVGSRFLDEYASQIELTAYKQLNQFADRFLRFASLGVLRDINPDVNYLTLDSLFSGLDLVARTPDNTKPYSNTVTVDVVSPEGNRVSIRGCLNEASEPRIRRIKLYEVDITPEGHHTFCEYDCTAGPLKAISTVTTKHGINVTELGSATNPETGRELGCFRTAQPLTKGVLIDIKKSFETDGLSLYAMKHISF
ncbi:MAG: NAD(P)-dependent oxidoreductase [Candidatus Woesearchaeota archaeon]